MAMKIPCVTSSLANNALGAIPNQEIIVCETPQDYVDSIIELLYNENNG